VNSNPDKYEKAHMARVKSLPCSVCGSPPPSQAHHADQSDAFTTIALCYDCHQDPKLGWHGEKAMWKIYKLTELKALGITVRRLIYG
jgi:hypothetical protein